MNRSSKRSNSKVINLDDLDALDDELDDNND